MELIHESTGLKIHKNPKNQFTVVTLHYTANPMKRSAAWKREAQAGMSAAKFAREYEMDYGAMFGERVFPEMLTHRANIVVPEPYPEFPSGQRYWGGFDYGLRNPSSFHVYTIWDGVTYAVWELFEPCRNIKEFVGKMLGCPYYEQIRYIAADPHIADLRHYNKDGNGASILDQFIEQGIRKLVMSTSDEEAWLAMMRRHWADPENPTFKILDRCPAMVAEFSGAVYAGQIEAIQSRNFKEAIADVNNHSIDDCKYFMLSMPQRQLQREGWKSPIMVNKWKK
jgi:hypothetical protein